MKFNLIFKNYETLPSEGHHGGMMDDMHDGETQWMHHMNEEHDDVDRKYRLVYFKICHLKSNRNLTGGLCCFTIQSAGFSLEMN